MNNTIEKEAINLMIKAGHISEPYLQRKFKITYDAAKKICDNLKSELSKK